MKLSEVIKAIEDGSKSSFCCGDIVIKSMYNAIEVLTGKWKVDGDFNNDNWQEVKPPRQWSEKELMLFKLFPWAKWISRELNGDILLSETKPEYVYDTIENYSYWEIQDSQEKFATISTENDKEITTATFEESPVYIGDLKGE